MPRVPDPELEKKIVAAALRLLDRGGEAAITLRSVAREAGTTTPTIYERFHDRDALLQRLIVLTTHEIVARLEPQPSIAKIFSEFLRYCCERPMRFNLTVETFATRLVSGSPMPAMELLRSRLAAETGINGRRREDLALAIVSLAFGTARGMASAGKGTRHAAELRRASLSALRMLLAAFTGANPARAARTN